MYVYVNIYIYDYVHLKSVDKCGKYVQIQSLNKENLFLEWTQISQFWFTH